MFEALYLALALAGGTLFGDSIIADTCHEIFVPGHSVQVCKKTFDSKSAYQWEVRLGEHKGALLTSQEDADAFAKAYVMAKAEQEKTSPAALAGRKAALE